MLFTTSNRTGVRSQSPDRIALIQQTIYSAGQSNDGPPNIQGWPIPKTLTKSTVNLFLGIGIGISMVIATLYFLMLIILVASLHGQSVESDDWEALTEILKYSSTAFTYIFAAIAARSTRSFARWRLERGISLGVLERLMGCSTVFGTVVTQIHLRSFNVLGFGLIVLWALSPIGSQSFLRIISTQNYNASTTVTRNYLDTSQVSKIGGTLDPNVFAEAFEAPIDAVYMAALMVPSSVQNSSVDLWGNVKIPYYRELGADPSSNNTGWEIVSQTNVVYSSLIGIPVANIASTGNAIFTMETSYLDLDCYNVSEVTYGGGYNAGYWSASNNSQFSISVSDYDSLHVPNGTQERLAAYVDSWGNATFPRTLLLQSRNWNSYSSSETPEMTAVYCTLLQSYVESAVSCSVNEPCRVTDMRLSQVPHPPENITVLSLPFLFQVFSQYFPVAAGPAGPTYMNNGVGDLPNSSYTELYIDNPTSAFRLEGVANLTRLSNHDLGIRIGQVLNTYYQASLEPFSMTGNLTSVPTAMIAVNGTLVTQSLQYVCNWPVLGLLSFSAIAMLFAAIFGIVFNHLAIGPDIIGYCSTLTRDNPYVKLPPGGSTLDGVERARLLMNLKLRLGDVGSGGQSTQGYIAVAPVEETRKITKWGKYC